MIQNFIKIAVRNFFKNKIYSFINISGLALGLASFVLIMTYIYYEKSYDKFHDAYERIYRPVEIQVQPGIATQHVAVTMGPLAEAMKNDFAGIEESCRIAPGGNMYLSYKDNNFYERNSAFADPTFLKMFKLNFLKGNPDKALEAPNSIILSESLANKYFGDEDPIGKTISAEHRFGEDDMVVTAVIEDYPANSHISFDLLGNIDLMIANISWAKNWNSNFLATYVKLGENVKQEEIEAGLHEFLLKYREDVADGNLKLYLQPLADIHLYSGGILYQTYNNNEGSISVVIVLGIVGIFVLILACINFMNLSTARSVSRAREVGIRKVLGSGRGALVWQFLSEALLMAFVSLFLGLLILEIIFPLVKPVIGEGIELNYYSNPLLLAVIFGATLIAGLLSGSYPAVFLSSWQPVKTLKGRFSANSSGLFIRKGLVIFQFFIAVVLISLTLIVYQQMDYIRSKDLGFNKEQVIYVPARNAFEREKLRLIGDQLRNSSNILSVSATSGLTGAAGTQSTMSEAGTDEENKVMMRFSFVDFDYINTMKMEIVKGRDFSREISSDSVSGIIINEAAVKAFGWSDPIGRRIVGDPYYEVIGVVKDFHFFSMHVEIQPLMMVIGPERFRYLVAKTAPGVIPEAIEDVNEAWGEFLGDRPCDYSFLDQYFEQMYEGEENLGSLFNLFTGLAIFIATLGLLGLSAFTAEQRTKEIGIRKTLGASTGGILYLLSSAFLRWVVIASVLAVPVSWYLAGLWLSDYVYSIDISPVIFFIAAFFALFIAQATVGYQAFKASRLNPSDTLRYE